ncbi:MAG: ribokinase [Rhodospirillaceae bacterium]|nr:ribokinase [Rhodospirillaceae bacterium]
MKKGSAKRLISLGACTVDVILKVPDVPVFDAKVIAEDGTVVGQGMAVTAACSAAALGGDVAVWGRIGSDRIGDFFLADLADAGVDTSQIRRAEGARTGVAAVICDAAGQRLNVPFYDPALGSDSSWLPVDQLDHVDCVLADTRWPEGSRRILAEAKARNLIRILDGDVASRDTIASLVPLASHAIFSEPGFKIFSGADDVLPTLLEEGSVCQGIIGVTLGERGFAWVEKDRVRTVPSPKVDVVDTLAAGDVFHGAFALATAEGRSVEEAGKFACAAAAVKCSRFGGRRAIPTREEVQTLVEDFY